MKSKYCIIGAGFCGLGVAKAFLDYGIEFDCFEKNEEIGGNWLNGVYDSTHIISSRDNTHFTDFPMPRDYPDFPSREQILTYLKSYADTFKLRPHIQFNTEVSHISPIDYQGLQGWNVRLSTGEVRHYTGVVVANGHHWNKRFPNYPGEFTGKHLHSKDYKNSKDFDGRRVLVVGAGNSGMNAVVTGGGSGLGRELCLQLAHRKARLIVADLHLTDAEKVAQEARSLGAPSADAIACDVRSYSEVEKMAEFASKTLGQIDLLVNNAGVAAAGDFHTLPLEDWKWVMETNLWGVIYGCHAFIPKMLSQGRGQILNIASAAGLLNPPDMAPYNVAKAGVISLSESLNAEYGHRGVKVTVACPMFFSSGIVDRARFQNPKSREFAEKVVKNSKQSAAEVAEACLHAIESQKLYVLPSLTGKVAWSLKRLMPSGFAKAAGMYQKQWRTLALKNTLKEKNT